MIVKKIEQFINRIFPWWLPSPKKERHFKPLISPEQGEIPPYIMELANSTSTSTFFDIFAKRKDGELLLSELLEGDIFEFITDPKIYYSKTVTGKPLKYKYDKDCILKVIKINKRSFWAIAYFSSSKKNYFGKCLFRHSGIYKGIRASDILVKLSSLRGQQTE